MDIFDKMDETKDSMDLFYCDLESGIELACEQCCFFSLFGGTIDFEFDRDYFTHNYGNAPLYYSINGYVLSCNENIDKELEVLIKKIKCKDHYDCYIKLFRLEVERFIEEVSSSNRSDVEDCLYFLAKWIYVNGISKDEEGREWHVYEWDIEDIKDQIDEIVMNP